MAESRDELERKRDELERALTKRLSEGDRDGAATQVLESYGSEIYSFLVAVHRSETDADEVFALFAEAFWQALPTFAGNSTFRTFAYAIARRLSYRYRRDSARKKKRLHTLESSDTSRLVLELRTRTAVFLRTETRSRLVELRASLPQEDQELLMLRVDRDLTWDALADVLRSDEEAPLTPEARKKEAARLRKRFQLIKDRLRDMARREGLLGDGE
jgi:RNA polymerase sigma-70 factor (ECF subfamily)